MAFRFAIALLVVAGWVPGLVAQEVTLEVGGTTVPVGETFTVPVSLGNSVGDIESYRVTVCHDVGVVEFVDSTPGPQVAAVDPFIRGTIVREGGTQEYAVFDSFFTDLLPVGDIPVLYESTYAVVTTEPQSTLLRVCFWVESLLSLEVLDTRVRIGGVDVTIDESPGVVEIVEAGAGFIRGDANGDGVVNIGDPIYALSFLAAGGPAPGCLAAADVNHDGVVDVGDPISVLSFITGGTPPAHPFPSCGTTPDVDVLGCVESNCP